MRYSVSIGQSTSLKPAFFASGIKPAKAKHHAAFPFFDDVDRIPEPDEPKADDAAAPATKGISSFPPEAREFLFRR